MGRAYRSRSAVEVAGTWLLVLASFPLATQPPKLRIEAHTTSPRYAYTLGACSLRVLRDCVRGQILLRLRIQVINHGTHRIDLPVQLQVGLNGSVQGWVSTPVPPVEPGRAAWVRIDVPWAPAREVSTGTRLQVALTAPGQSWNREQVTTPVAIAPCPRQRPQVATHVREKIR